LAEGYGKQAVGFLRTALAWGFKNLDYLRKAAVFARLRQRSDFQSLLADSAKKKP
jgi:hypothetical protein